MSNPWLRLYREALHDPKLVTLPDRQHRAWFNCLLIADDTGKLPSNRDIAAHMRTTVVEAEQLICDLVEAGLIDVDAMGGAPTYKMHGWSKRQYASDSSAERMKRHRAKKRDVTVTASDVTSYVLESEPETETETENKFFPSEQDPARGEGNELGFDFGLMNGKGKREDIRTIAARAEGLGLDAADLLGTTSRAKPKKPTAYMTALCVNRLKERLPGLDEQILRDALWGKPQPFATVSKLLLEVLP